MVILRFFEYICVNLIPESYATFRIHTFLSFMLLFIGCFASH